MALNKWQGFCLVITIIFNTARGMKEKDNILKDLGLEVSSHVGQLKVDFGSTKLSYGEVLPLAAVKNKPSIKIPKACDAKYFTLMMVDPDAPNRNNPTARVCQLFSINSAF